jgi:hypothetical protein
VDVAFGLLVEESITLLRVGVRQPGGSSTTHSSAHRRSRGTVSSVRQLTATLTGLLTATLTDPGHSPVSGGAGPLSERRGSGSVVTPASIRNRRRAITAVASGWPDATPRSDSCLSFCAGRVQHQHRVRDSGGGIAIRSAPTSLSQPPRY